MEHHYTLVGKGISADEEKIFHLLSKKAAVLTVIRKGLFGEVHGWRGKICHTCPTIMKLGIRVTYLKKNRKIYRSHDTPLEFW